MSGWLGNGNLKKTLWAGALAIVTGFVTFVFSIDASVEKQGKALKRVDTMVKARAPSVERIGEISETVAAVDERTQLMRQDLLEFRHGIRERDKDAAEDRRAMQQALDAIVARLLGPTEETVYDQSNRPDRDLLLDP
jgi:hypothetical protein